MRWFGFWMLVLLAMSGCTLPTVSMQYQVLTQSNNGVTPVTDEVLPAAKFIKKAWDVCAGDVWQFALRWEVAAG